MWDNTHFLTVSDLKQYSYCARVVFYEHCLPHVRPRTYKMDAGREAHESEHKRAIRRTLSKYEVEGGNRKFDVPLESPNLRLRGLVDEVVFAENGEIFPVDYKMTRKVSPNHRLQLTAYAMLLEEAYQVPVQRGFIYLITARSLVEVRITPETRQQTVDALAELESMIAAEKMPDPTVDRQRCFACEFRRFCNDV